MRQSRCRDDGGIRDSHTMMQFVLFFQAAENRDGLFDRRFTDKHRLKTARQGSVFFNVLAVLVEGRRTHAMQFAAGKSGLQHV